MTVSANHRGNYESRHVTDIREGDLVWDDDRGRYRTVTSVWRYTTDVGHHDMVKLVFDLSTFIRHAASEDARYDALLDDEPHSSVEPETATRRRKRLRSKSSEEPEETTPEPIQNTPEQTPKPPAGRVEPVGGIRARREALRIPRAKFAEMCGLSAGALWRVEDGRPKNDELSKVMATLESQEAKQ